MLRLQRLPRLVQQVVLQHVVTLALVRPCVASRVSLWEAAGQGRPVLEIQARNLNSKNLERDLVPGSIT